MFSDDYTTPKPLLNPCLSSPCGPNAECLVNEDSYTCKCLPNFINNPPNCRAECITNDHCFSNMTCVNQHCIDPCSNEVCGVNADCRVDNHSIVCECQQNYTGNALVECFLMETISENHPCNLNPCGENAICREKNGSISCLCLPDFYGNPIKGCVPKCTSNSDCLPNQICLESICLDPCQGICPENADCLVKNQVPLCICKEGYTGNAYQNCTRIENQNGKSEL